MQISGQLRDREGKFAKHRFVRGFIRFVKTFVVIGVITAGAFSLIKIGGILSPITVYAEKRIEVTTEAVAPVLDRIAQCESNAKHYKNGQVLIMANTNKTVDIGYYQINSIWNAKASTMGYDLTKEEDNKSFGRWLYANYGTEPWVYTKTCWNK